MITSRWSLVLASSLVFLSGCSFPTSLTQQFTPAALDVDATPKADVWLDDISLGTTPIKSKRVKIGSHIVKLKSGNQTWSDQIMITSSTITVVNRDFLADTNRTAGEVVEVETGQGLSIIGTPIGADISVDGQSIGTIPVEATEILPGIHDVTVSAVGYQKRTIKPRITTGYKIIMSVDLAKETDTVAVASSASPSSTPQPTSIASETPLSTQMPAPTIKPSTSVVVTKTPNGWLRVRAEASTNAKELFRVTEGDILEILDEQTSWMKIQTASGQSGWASSQYLEKQ